jgi:hypothetical protein
MKIYNLAFLLLFIIFSSSLLLNCHPSPKTEKAGIANIVFRSTDGGQTWQDISNGLPETVKDNHGIGRNVFYANDNGLYLTDGNLIYHSITNSTAPFWTKEILPDKHISIAPVKSQKFFWGVNLIKTDGMSVWSPIFENFQEPRIRTVFETAGGTIFIGTDRGIFKTDNSGKTWKHVYTGSLVGNMAESNGVLLSTSMRKIIRSTDNGENWALAISEDSVAFDVKSIKGGFAAITSNSELNTPKLSRLSTSFDSVKTWQSIHSGIQDKVVLDSIGRTWDDRPRLQRFMTPIIQVGENFLCAHPYGIFKSLDKGKTWKLLLPSIEHKVFNLFVSGNVIYAIQMKSHC